jgi:hypothetical protein
MCTVRIPVTSHTRAPRTSEWCVPRRACACARCTRTDAFRGALLGVGGGPCAQFKKKYEWEAKKAVGLEDMVLVSKISDDTMADNIRKRYLEDLIYVRAAAHVRPPQRPHLAGNPFRVRAQTYIGPILIAVNPYKSLPYYTQTEVDMYNGCVRPAPMLHNPRLCARRR